ncbi:antibiotic resistance protein MarC [Amycolatopsis sp. WAC 01376]|uniref:MarC family protein n=1 Tax=Amycolatopsis sp. WAC 01376 TaxID=2203195 RepID=UPI000F78B0C3|nr:MarC family protein [Amycolatopsis sp. WAC 01376]RSM54388.1 antibiotic resistance protein MarC [Amycolatopsis sp. WAC 01376]
MTITDFFDARLFMSATITLIVIMDPPGTVPVFLSLTGRKSVAFRAKAARQAVLVSLLVISLFAVAGQAILSYLGIGIPALQGAGGLLLLLIALQLLTGETGGEAEAAGDDVNVALVPLGTPLLAGPGAIAATIVFVRQADGHVGAYVALALSIVTVHFVLYLCMRYSGVVIRLIKESGITLLAKIAGLLLAAIAVELVANSVKGFIAGT